MRAVEASKRSAEPLHKAHQEPDEVLDNLLKTVEDFDNQVHSVTMREDSLVVGAELPPGDGKGHCTDRTMILLALPHRHKGSHIVQAPPETKVEMRPRGSTGRRTPEIGIGAQCATSTGLPQARPLAACSHYLWSRECFLRLAVVSGSCRAAPPLGASARGSFTLSQSWAPLFLTLFALCLAVGRYHTQTQTA